MRTINNIMIGILEANEKPKVTIRESGSKKPIEKPVQKTKDVKTPKPRKLFARKVDKPIEQPIKKEIEKPTEKKVEQPMRESEIKHKVRNTSPDIKYSDIIRMTPEIFNVFYKMIYPAITYAYANTINPKTQQNKTFIFNEFLRVMYSGKMMHMTGVDKTSELYTQLALPKFTALVSQTTLGMLKFYIDTVIFKYASDKYGNEDTSENINQKGKYAYLEFFGEVAKAGFMAPFNLITSPFRALKLGKLINMSDYVPISKSTWKAISLNDPLYHDTNRAKKMWNILLKNVFSRVTYQCDIMTDEDMAQVNTNISELVKNAFSNQDIVNRSKKDLSRAIENTIIKRNSQFRIAVFKTAGSINKQAKGHFGIDKLKDNIPDFVKRSTSPAVKDYYDILTTNMSGVKGFDNELDEPIEYDRRGRVKESRGVTDTAWDAFQQLQLRSHNKDIAQLKEEMRAKGFSSSMTNKVVNKAAKEEKRNG